MKKEELLKYLNPRNEHRYSYNQKKQAYKEIVALIETQPTITSGDVQGWADEIRERVCAHKSWMYVEDAMKEMLTELGVTITGDRGK